MSKNIPNSYTRQETTDTRGKQPVTDADWASLAEAQNYVWQESYERWGGVVFDPPFETTSTDWTQSPENDSRSLDSVRIGGVLDRPIKVFTDKRFRAEIQIYGDDIEVEVDFVNRSSGGTIGTATLASGTTSYADTSIDFSETSVTDDWGFTYIDTNVKAKSGDGRTASLLSLVIGGAGRQTLDAANLPDGQTF